MDSFSKFALKSDWDVVHQCPLSFLDMAIDKLPVAIDGNGNLKNTLCVRKLYFFVYFHARMREILKYLHILKTTSMFYMYEPTIVNKILMQVL